MPALFLCILADVSEVLTGACSWQSCWTVLSPALPTVESQRAYMGRSPVLKGYANTLQGSVYSSLTTHAS